MITGPEGYDTQKAICHATGYKETYNQLCIFNYLGGWCFIPLSCEEGTRLFEMEVLLSVRQRSKTAKPTQILSRVN